MFLDFPEELLDLCCQHADRWSLRALRLTNKQTLPAATKCLFSHVTVRPTKDSAQSCRNIMNDDILRPLVENITLLTPEEEDDFEDDSVDGEAGLDQEYSDRKLPETSSSVIRDIGRFANLRSVELNFAKDCAAPDGPWWQSSESVQTYEFRNSAMEVLFKGLNHVEHPATRVHSLSINNLQDIVHAELTKSQNFKEVLARLDTLALNICTEYDDAAPETSHTRPDLHQFFNSDLKAAWLCPVQSQLTSLTLYADTYWGYFPSCDLQNLHFPKLKDLALGNFNFAHEHQLEWILSHGSTLQSLSLDDCPILHECHGTYCNFGPNRAAPDISVYHSDTGHEDSSWQYEARWHNYLPRIKSGLPHLRHFAFGHGPWNDSDFSAFLMRSQLQASLVSGRYIIFDGGVGPTPYIEPCKKYFLVENEHSDGWMHTQPQMRVTGYEYEGLDRDPMPMYPDCWQEDSAALADLLSETRKRQGWVVGEVER